MLQKYGCYFFHLMIEISTFGKSDRNYDFMKKFCFLYYSLCLLALVSSIANAQSLLDYRNTLNSFSGFIRTIKNHHPDDVLIKSRMDIQDIADISEVKDSLFKIEYLRLSFKTQEELDTLCSFLSLFPNLKALSFDEFRPFQDRSDSQPTLVLPDEFYKRSKLVVIEFRGHSKINVEKELVKISGLPNLRYLIFSASNPDDFPRNIQSLKKLCGISLEYDKRLIGIKLPTALEEIEIVSSNNNTNLEDAFQLISNPQKIKQLTISYFQLGLAFKSSISFPALRNLDLYSNEIQDLGLFLKNFEKSKYLQSLKVKNGRTASISSDLYQFSNLQKLAIINNSDDLKIPEGISKLSRLTNLDLSGNKIVDLPEDLYQLQSLEQLNLSYNKLANLSEKIGLLSGLTNLKLQSNQFAQLPRNINSLQRLISLNLQANPLIRLPPLTNLINLDTLNLSYCNLAALPADMGALQNLRYLNVEDNFIERLPASIVQLTKLNELLLTRNLLTELSSDIGSLGQLEVLDLGVNHLKNLPRSIGRLKKLKTLNVSHNLLTSLPEEIVALSDLSYFFAENRNPTHYSLYDWSREIYREDNPKTDRKVTASKLISFPNDLSTWENIESINLSHNDFSSFDIMKAVLTIPAKDFKLNLSNSHIKILPDSGWSNFLGRELDLHNNEIDKLPRGIAKSPSLSAINLRNNILPKIPKNQNADATKRNEVLLYFEQVGLISEYDLPQEEEMAVALMEKSYQYFLYDKDYKSSLEMYEKAFRIDSNLVFKRSDLRSVGEANYHMHHYHKAVEYLTHAIQQDTVGPMLIMNFVITDFEYRAKSYLALKDTSNALQDYLQLARHFDHSYWTQVAMLYEQMSQMEKGRQAYQKAIGYYQWLINDPQMPNDEKELSMLCIMELYIVSNQYLIARHYAEKIKNNLTEGDLIPIFDYLEAIIDTASGRQSDFSPATFKGKVSRRWGYDLLSAWLATVKLNDDQVFAIKEMTSTMIANRTK